MLRPTVTIELVWQDETGTRATSVLNLPSATEPSEAFSAAEAALDAFTVLSGAALVLVRVKYRTAFEVRSPAGGDTPITETGVFFFSSGPSTPDAGIVVHALKPSALLTTGPAAGVAIDLASSAVTGFADAVLSLPCTNPFADDLLALFAAYRQSRV